MKTPLRTCRTHERFSLEKLAREVGSSIATISRLERGGEHDVSGRLCLNLLDKYQCYGLTLDHLINPLEHPDFHID